MKNASSPTFINYDERINDLRLKIGLLVENTNEMETKYTYLFKCSKKEEISSMCLNNHYKYRIYESADKTFFKKTKKEDNKYIQYIELANLYKATLNKYNRQLYRYNEMHRLVEGIIKFRKNFNVDLVRFGFDRKNRLICFLSNNIKDSDLNCINRIDGFVIDKDYTRTYEYGYCQLIYRPREDYIELRLIDMRDNKRLGWGSFALSSIECLVIKDINEKIDIYSSNMGLSNRGQPNINKIIGLIGGFWDYVFGRGKRKRFYCKNGYRFQDRSNFIRELDT